MTVKVHVGGGGNPTPERDLQQRREALARGNRVRLYRAQMKRGIKDGTLPPDQFLRVGRTDPMLATMKVAEALANTPTLGEERVRKVMLWAHVSPSKSFAGMSPAQYDRLMRVLEDSCAGLMRRCYEWERDH